MKSSRKKNKGLAQKRRNGKIWLKVLSSGIVEEIFKKNLCTGGGVEGKIEEQVRVFG